MIRNLNNHRMAVTMVVTPMAIHSSSLSMRGVAGDGYELLQYANETRSSPMSRTAIRMKAMSLFAYRDSDDGTADMCPAVWKSTARLTSTAIRYRN